MAVVSEDIVQRLDYLLDLLYGSDVDSRDARGGALDGAMGTHSHCLGCSFNRARWGYCPACDGTGLVPDRNGEYDPYLTRYSLHDRAIERTTRVSDAPASPEPHRETPTGEHIHLSRVEREASKLLRYRHVLAAIVRLLRRAPESIRQGAPPETRDRATVEWLAKRLAYVPPV